MILQTSLRRLPFFSYMNTRWASTMPILDKTVERHLPQQPLKNSGILCIQHSLETMIPVISALAQLGAKDIFIIGKQYSESKETVSKLLEMPGIHYHRQTNQTALGQFIPTFQRNVGLLWEKIEQWVKQQSDIQKILVLDHGGYATQMIPECSLPIVVIEKTTAGVNREDSSYLPFPRIEMATAAVKKELESPAIAMAITQKLSQKLLPEIYGSQLICGVVGYGSIGKAISEHLLQLGHRVLVYHLDNTKTLTLPVNLHKVSDLNTVISNANVIFGCTGQDMTQNLDPFYFSPSNKTLVSCSSDDIEFRTLLRHIQKTRKTYSGQPSSDIEFSTHMQGKIKILRGGFPVNFDNMPESVPAKHIQLTRSLLISACVQAANYKFNSEKMDIMLSPHEQLIIARQFIETLKIGDPNYPRLDEFDKLFSQSDNQCLKWIEKHSGGYIDKNAVQEYAPE